jgi:NAD(P)-dependent dehydrogenase (short-subunit alcohol dehydrogenase family)
MSSLRDQVALVTGSSRGIGAAIAKLYAQQGANAAVHGRDGAALATLVDAHPAKRLGTPEVVAQAGSFSSRLARPVGLPAWCWTSPER